MHAGREETVLGLLELCMSGTTLPCIPSLTVSAIRSRNPKVDVSIEPFLALESLISHPQIQNLPCLLAQMQRPPFCCIRTQTNQMVILVSKRSRRSHLSHSRAHLFAATYLFLLWKTSEQNGGRIWKKHSQMQSQALINPVLYLQCKKAGIQTEAHTYSEGFVPRCNVIHTMGKPLSDRRELCSALHMLIWLPFVTLLATGVHWEEKKSLYFQRFTWWLQPHITSGNTDMITRPEALRDCADWHLTNTRAAKAPREPFCTTLISRAARLVISPRESPLISQRRNSLLSMVTGCVVASKAARACGFSLLMLKVS